MNKPILKKKRLSKALGILALILKISAVIVLLIGGGLFLYVRYLPFEIEGQKPSQIVAPLMSKNLPFLLGKLEPTIVMPNFEVMRAISAIKKEMAKSGPLQAAWATADELCTDMLSFAAERRIAAGALLQKNNGGKMKWWQSLMSNLDIAEISSRKAYYFPDPEKPWEKFTSLQRNTIAKKYLDLLALEEPVVLERAAKSLPVMSSDKGLENLICPLCKGEGRIMVRKVVRGTINDVSNSCPLCIGAGKKTLRLPNKAKICADCLGFGRRLVQRAPTNDKPNNNQNQKGQNDAVSSMGGQQVQDGVFGNLPQITSCSRCLSRGYILQPGL